MKLKAAAGPLPSIRLFLVFLAAPTVTAAKFPSALDTREPIFDGQPVHDNVLLLPLTGQPASSRIDGLLDPSNLWPRRQAPICAVNYSVCVGIEYCCPDGNVCCPGEFSWLSADPFEEGGEGYGRLSCDHFTHRCPILGGTCCDAGYGFHF